MRFVQFILKDVSKVVRIGIQNASGAVIDITSVLPGCHNLVEALNVLGPESLMEKAKSCEGNECVNENQLCFLSPITSPDKVACVGMNYIDHCEEIGTPPPKEPVFFNKFPSSIIGPYENIPYPSVSEAVDWEVELAIVIGRRGKNIDLHSAYDYIFGYTVAHDVSARDWQLHKNGGQWLLGKTMDGFCPLGPSLVTRDEIADPHQLNLTCKVNGEVKQSSSTSKMIHHCDAIVSFLSKFCTLLPGDVILTGTPPGVGVFAKPPQYLKRGDVVECEVEKIGIIRNGLI